MKKSFLLLLLTAIIGSAAAVPAYPGKIVFTQPGTEITVTIFLKGDERVHWAETEDGYSLIHSDDGSLVYAKQNAQGDMIPTTLLATDIDSRSAEVETFLKATPKHLHFSKRQVEEMLMIWKQVENAKSGPKTMSDVTGHKKFLVILFGFSDKDFTHSKMEFRSLFNQVNYTASNRTGSVHDYYYDVSKGLFSLNVDIAGPYIGVNNIAYYGATDYGYQAFAHEAVDSAAKDVDFSIYDNDNDGYIDGLHIIFAGYGEEAGASSDCIWSHKWNIFDPPTYNNTVIDVYSCSPECQSYYGDRITNIGVICHELGHVFGAPDFYDTDYAGSGGEYPGLGNWDIMSGGSWNRNGITPAQHNPYTKLYIYRWATCDTIDGSPRKIVMDPADITNNDIHRVNTSTPGDFFLIENRQQIKWDKFIPGHGMLVYHVHPNANGSHVANYQHPQQIYIIAKGSATDTFPNSNPSSYGNLNLVTAAFPGEYARRDSLTDNSVPWFRPWSKQANNIPFYNISENTATNKVYLTVGSASPDPMDASAEGIDNESILLNWTPYGSYHTIIVASEDNVFGTLSGSHSVGDTLTGGGIVIYKGSDSRHLATGLQNNHLYHFRLYACINDSTYSNSIEAQAHTLNCENSDWQYEDFETVAQGSMPECWDGSWSVESLMGQLSLASPATDQHGNYNWQSVSSRPFTYDTLHNAVLHFRVHFDENCNEQTCFKTEYRNGSTSGWQVVDSANWSFGMAMWQERYIQLGNAGDRSRLRFSAFTDGSHQVFLDDIDITQGSLIYATSDANGSISPYGYSILGEDDTIEYIITALDGYRFQALTIDGVGITLQDIVPLDTLGKTYRYLLTGISGQHTLKALFHKNAGIETADAYEPTVSPNPTSGIIHVTGRPGSTMTLYDITGRQLVRKHTDDGTMTISLEGLPQGIYLLRDGVSTVKVVKK